MVGSVTILI